MSKKLLMVLMCVCVLITGCSKKPLKSMTIGQVRQLTFDWYEGKLPEQQPQGTAEIRKELEVLEEQLGEQIAKDKVQLGLLWKQISEQKAERDKKRLLLDEQDKERTEKERAVVRLEAKRAKEKIRSSRGLTASETWMGWGESTELLWAYQKRCRLREEQCRKQWQEAKKKHSLLEIQLGEQRSEFRRKNIGSLESRLRSDKSVKTFYKVFGKPKDKSLIGNNYYFQYRCKDGLVILEINAWDFDNGNVWIISGVSML